jgi:D-sedoheptulose 7-phosphate isomerase
MEYIKKYLEEVKLIVEGIDRAAVNRMIEVLLDIRANNGRLFFLGVGGGAGNASHAVNDFRKITGIESYSPCDNVSELTARINDDGWESTFAAWLCGCKLNAKDGIFVFSVGGGDIAKNISTNLVRALEYARLVKAQILGVVGRDGGYTRQVANACLVIPTVNPQTITPHTESFQAVIWHLLATHPRLLATNMKWESMGKGERYANLP